MDSLSQIALGGAVSVAVMGRHSAAWRAALAGAVLGTLPDLDVLIDHGDAVRNMVLHRAETHSLFWLSLVSVPLAAGVVGLMGQRSLWWRWWLACWLALVTHPLLDAMTVYGTQLGLPWTDHPYAVGSVFIVDPLYTLPLLVGVTSALRTSPGGWGLRANTLGLLLSSLYLGWGVLAQQQVSSLAQAELRRQGLPAQQVLVTPTPLNTVLWRVIAVDGDHFFEGFYSLLDADTRIHFDAFSRGTSELAAVSGLEPVQRLSAFTQGFFKLQRRGDQLLITDLRMGQEPGYVFSFVVAQSHGPLQAVWPTTQVGARLDLARGLPWLWRRALGEPLPPPR